MSGVKPLWVDGVAPVILQEKLFGIHFCDAPGSLQLTSARWLLRSVTLIMCPVIGVRTAKADIICRVERTLKKEKKGLVEGQVRGNG
jgi:hypothetical protein